MTDEKDPNKSPFGWKMIITSFICSVLFLAIIYLAINNEPDYMPSQQKQQQATASEVMQDEHSMHGMAHAGHDE